MVQYCEQCGYATYDTTRVAYRYTERVAGENPAYLWEMDLCEHCLTDLRHMEKNRFVENVQVLEVAE